MAVDPLTDEELVTVSASQDVAIYKEGFDAAQLEALQGIPPPLGNPYQPGTPQNAAWEAGKARGTEVTEPVSRRKSDETQK